ncbi:hypothetical protein L0P88_13000 [Muricauda sp. SCSIO 64092]|uniref:hypothetical protein n=1 Tax=Allomuricauda sp. SCSIO 64092 TaxID=2908842 RepID=UPI001FF2A1C9|nr:hypothetical protein [Muricauda sp. SCSIO 64092]UOY04870.1 hypothetical protein L0P88_13000 [Muricauda sp. SCSIO 64092]
MRTFLWLSIFFSCYGMAQEDPLVGQWQRMGFYIHECGTDKVISTDVGTAGFIEKFRADGTWEVLKSSWKGNWQRLEDNTYRFVTESRFMGRSISSVDTIRVEFQENDLKLYRITCDTVQVGDKKHHGYLLLRRLDKKQTNLGF